MLKTNEHVGADASQLPKHKQQEHILCQSEAEHRPHKDKEPGIEAPQVGVPFQIASGVHHDQRPHPADEEGEEQSQSIRPEGKNQSELR